MSVSSCIRREVLVVSLLVAARAAIAQEPLQVTVDGNVLALDHKGYGVPSDASIYQFGDVVVGTSRQAALTLTNVGSTPFDIRDASGRVGIDESQSPASFSVVDNLAPGNIRLNPGESWTIALQFVPVDNIARRASVRIDTLGTPAFYNWFEIRGRGVFGTTAPPTDQSGPTSESSTPIPDSLDSSFCGACGAGASWTSMVGLVSLCLAKGRRRRRRRPAR